MMELLSEEEMPFKIRRANPTKMEKSKAEEEDFLDFTHLFHSHFTL